MQKSHKSIEIVSSTNAELSSMSRESREAVQAVLSKHYTQVRITTLECMADLEALVDRKPDLVFLGMKFVNDGQAKVWISKYLDNFDIQHTGSDYLAHALDIDKPMAKRMVLSKDLQTAKFEVIHCSQPMTKLVTTMTFPLFVKPSNRGGGLGIDSESVVNSYDELYAKVNTIAETLRSDSLIEEYLSGREFSVAILKDAITNEFLAMPIELIAPPNKQGVRMLSEEIKSSNTEQAIKVSDKDIKKQVCDLALAVFHVLGARDYGRIDIRLDKGGVPHFLEANLIPSLIDGYGSFPKACALNIGMGYEDIILNIVALGMQRTTPEVQESILDLVPVPA